MGFRVEPRQIGPQQEEEQKQRFFRKDQIHIRHLYFYFFKSIDPTDNKTDQRNHKTGHTDKFCHLTYGQGKHGKSAHRNPENLGEQPSPIRIGREQRCRYRVKSDSDDQNHDPPFQKGTLSLPKSGMVASTIRIIAIPATVDFLLMFSPF